MLCCSTNLHLPWRMKSVWSWAIPAFPVWMTYELVSLVRNVRSDDSSCGKCQHRPSHHVRRSQVSDFGVVHRNDALRRKRRNRNPRSNRRNRNPQHDGGNTDEEGKTQSVIFTSIKFWELEVTFFGRFLLPKKSQKRCNFSRVIIISCILLNVWFGSFV